MKFSILPLLVLAPAVIAAPVAGEAAALGKRQGYGSCELTQQTECSEVHADPKYRWGLLPSPSPC